MPPPPLGAKSQFMPDPPPGFIVNRVARPYYAEALRLVEECAAPMALIDRLLVAGAGFQMGPFRLMDLIGNDVNASVTKATFDAFFGDPRFRPSLLQSEYVAAGRFGRKSGQGFYGYSKDAIEAPRVATRSSTTNRARAGQWQSHPPTGSSYTA